MLTKRIIICNLYEYSYHLLPGRIGAAPEAVVTCMYEGGRDDKTEPMPVRPPRAVPADPLSQ